MALYAPNQKNCVEAWKMTESFALSVDGGDTTYGQIGDYLVKFAAGIRIVPKDEFEAEYHETEPWGAPRATITDPSRIIPWEQPNTYTLKVK